MKIRVQSRPGVTRESIRLGLGIGHWSSKVVFYRRLGLTTQGVNLLCREGNSLLGHWKPTVSYRWRVSNVLWPGCSFLKHKMNFPKPIINKEWPTNKIPKLIKILKNKGFSICLDFIVGGHLFIMCFWKVNFEDYFSFYFLFFTIEFPCRELSNVTYFYLFSSNIKIQHWSSL